MVRAAVIHSAGEKIEIHDIDIPRPGPGEIRVRIAAAGVCHSDLSIANGRIAPRFPVVLGHEAAGTVADVGTGVTRVRIGDPVVLNWAPACRSCWFCEHDEPWLCKAAEGVLSRPLGTLEDGTEVHAALGVGAFAAETVVAENAVVPLPPELPLESAALLGCAVLTGVGAVRKTAAVRSGESVVVIGLGGIGLSTVAGAKLAGAGPIIAVDVSPAKEELARAMGATDFIVADDKVGKAVRALTGGRGADHAFECVGRAATIRTAWQTTRRGGRCTVVGLGARDDMVSFSALELFHFARTLTSSVYGSSDPDVDIPFLAEHVLKGALDLDSLVSHRITIEEIPDAFTRMAQGVGARSLITFP